MVTAEPPPPPGWSIREELSGAGWLSYHIIPKNTPIYTLFENGGIFNLDALKRGWQEFANITHPEPRLHYENKITLDELWEKFFSKPSPEWVNLSTLKDREKQGQGDEKTPVSEMGVNKGIFKPNGPQIEEIGRPTIQTVTDALLPFRGGGQVSKSKFSEITGIPEDILKGFFNELVERNVIIDRGSLIEVV